MRSAFWVGCAALLLSACSNEPVQQATAAHVTPGMKAAMSSSGQANCAMIGGSLSVARQLDGSVIGMCALPNGKRCSEQSLAVDPAVATDYSARLNISVLSAVASVNWSSVRSTCAPLRNMSPMA